MVKPASLHVTDKKPKGPSAGDRSVETTKLLNAVPQFGKAEGAVVGHDKATIVLKSRTSATMTGVTYLPGGTLTVRGRLTPDPRGGVIAPVVRGSGTFKGARGTIWIVRTTGPTRVLNVYALRYSAG